MAKIIVDSNLVAKLQESREPINLCDESGRILGRFFPEPTAADYEAAERARPKLSEEELQMIESGPTFTTAEVIRHLESL